MYGVRRLLGLFSSSSHLVTHRRCSVSHELALVVSFPFKLMVVSGEAGEAVTWQLRKRIQSSKLSFQTPESRDLFVAFLSSFCSMELERETTTRPTHHTFNTRNNGWGGLIRVRLGTWRTAMTKMHPNDVSSVVWALGKCSFSSFFLTPNVYLGSNVQTTG